MAPNDHPPDGRTPESLDHTLKTPLTTIWGRSQLLTRTIRRSSSMDEGEREKLLEGLAVIDVAVQQLVAVVDGINDGP